MSETTAEVALPVVPNFAIAPGQMTNGKATHHVTFGTRNLEFRELSLADTWDLLEQTPADVNPTWQAMASMAYSLSSLDGTPVPPRSPSRSLRDDLRQRIERLGQDGMTALLRANATRAEQSTTAPATSDAAADATWAAAKN